MFEVFGLFIRLFIFEIIRRFGLFYDFQIMFILDFFVFQIQSSLSELHFVVPLNNRVAQKLFIFFGRNLMLIFKDVLIDGVFVRNYEENETEHEKGEQQKQKNNQKLLNFV